MKRTNGKGKNGKSNGHSNGHTNVTSPTILSDDGFETIGGATGQEMAIGEVVTGVYGGIIRTMPGKKRGTSIPFYLVGDRSLLGSTVLKSRIEEGEKLGKVTRGCIMRVTRLEDSKKKPGQNPAKVYKVEVKAAN